MKENEFDPYVRFCSSVIRNTDYEKAVKAYDFRLFFVAEGGFYAHVNENVFCVLQDDVLIIPPATPYRLQVGNLKKSKHIIVNFDMCSDHFNTPAIPPSESKNFDDNKLYSLKTFSPFDKVLHVKNAYFANDILQSMCLEMKEQKELAPQLISAKLKILLVLINREICKANSQKANKISVLIDNVEKYIDANLGKQITSSKIAKEFGYHPYYLSSVFKKRIGNTLHDLITQKRLTKAKELLLSSQLSIEEIAVACGFGGASYFSEVFKANFKITPSVFRGGAM